MSFEDRTRRLSVPPRQTTGSQTTASQTTAALPRPLNLADDTPSQHQQQQSQGAADTTDELSLTEIFEAPAEQPSAADPAVSEAPTWTAMPVIPVRSEPASAPTTDRTTDSEVETSQSDTERTGPSSAEQLRSDAAAAWSGAVRRTQTWLARDDNGLMLMTAIVAIILIVVVAAVGS
jgi:hypothetical protein